MSTGTKRQAIRDYIGRRAPSCQDVILKFKSQKEPSFCSFLNLSRRINQINSHSTILLIVPHFKSTRTHQQAREKNRGRSLLPCLEASDVPQPTWGLLMMIGIAVKDVIQHLVQGVTQSQKIFHHSVRKDVYPGSENIPVQMIQIH